MAEGRAKAHSLGSGLAGHGNVFERRDVSATTPPLGKYGARGGEKWKEGAGFHTEEALGHMLPNANAAENRDFYNIQAPLRKWSGVERR